MLYTKFQTGGEWDAKPYIEARYGYTASDPDLSWISGEDGSVRADAFGNINYALILAAYGVEEEVALAASHASGPDVGYGSNSTYDDAAIAVGYSMFREFGASVTMRQYASWIAGSAVVVP